MAEIVEVTAENWRTEVLERARPIVVNFWGPRCTWCHRLDPLYEEMATEFGDRLQFAKFNVALGPQHAIGLGIMGTPTLKFFCRGRAIHEIVGFRPRDQLRREIERVLETANECVDQSTPLP